MYSLMLTKDRPKGIITINLSLSVIILVPELIVVFDIINESLTSIKAYND